MLFPVMLTGMPMTASALMSPRSRAAVEENFSGGVEGVGQLDPWLVNFFYLRFALLV